MVNLKLVTVMSHTPFVRCDTLGFAFSLLCKFVFQIRLVESRSCVKCIRKTKLNDVYS